MRVAVDAAAVNFPDLLMLANRYQVTIPLPYSPGAEFSGIIVEVGPQVTGLNITSTRRQWQTALSRRGRSGSTTTA